MDKENGAYLKGFTIIETMLFLALSGLLMVGILGGLGGNIARQRYNDAVQDTVNMLRDQYSFVSDTEIAVRSKGSDTSCYGLVKGDFTSSPNEYFKSTAISTPESISYRGRTNCVIYGAVILINEDYIETTELIGRDYQATMRARGDTSTADKTDIELLHEYVSANNVFFHCDANYKNCYVRSADNSRIQKAKWGTKFVNTDGTPMHKTLLIFRSPRDGSIQTYVMNRLVDNPDNPGKPLSYANDLNSQNGGLGNKSKGANGLEDYGINKYLVSGTNGFNIADLNICVDSGDAQTYNNARRLVKVHRGGRGQNAVELINLDVAKEQSEGQTLGETECH